MTRRAIPAYQASPIKRHMPRKHIEILNVAEESERKLIASFVGGRS